MLLPTQVSMETCEAELIVSVYKLSFCAMTAYKLSILDILVKDIIAIVGFRKYYIMDKNNPFPNKIRSNRTNGAIYSKMNLKVEFCSAF